MKERKKERKKERENKVWSQRRKEEKKKERRIEGKKIKNNGKRKGMSLNITTEKKKR